MNIQNAQPGDTILITVRTDHIGKLFILNFQAGAGGVGGFAIQIANLMGNFSLVFFVNCYY